MAYLIYQKTLTDGQTEAINKDSTTPLAKAYFALLFPTDDNAQEVVTEALNRCIYERTMIISHRDGLGVSLDEDVFHVGNGYAKDGIIVTSIKRHPSMSVGDLAVNLLDGDVYLCMPQGWKHLYLELRLEEY